MWPIAVAGPSTTSGSRNGNYFQLRILFVFPGASEAAVHAADLSPWEKVLLSTVHFLTPSHACMYFAHTVPRLRRTAQPLVRLWKWSHTPWMFITPHAQYLSGTAAAQACNREAGANLWIFKVIILLLFHELGYHMLTGCTSWNPNTDDQCGDSNGQKMWMVAKLKLSPKFEW